MDKNGDTDSDFLLGEKPICPEGTTSGYPNHCTILN